MSAIWSLMMGPSRTMLTRASSSDGTHSSWHLSGNPLKGLASPSIWRHTICAAHARWTATLSLSSSQALARAAPTSSSNAIRLSLHGCPFEMSLFDEDRRSQQDVRRKHKLLGPYSLSSMSVNMRLHAAGTSWLSPSVFSFRFSALCNFILLYLSLHV